MEKIEKLPSMLGKDLLRLPSGQLKKLERCEHRRMISTFWCIKEEKKKRRVDLWICLSCPHNKPKEETK